MATNVEFAALPALVRLVAHPMHMFEKIIFGPVFRIAIEKAHFVAASVPIGTPEAVFLVSVELTRQEVHPDFGRWALLVLVTIAFFVYWTHRLAPTWTHYWVYTNSFPNWLFVLLTA